MVEAALDRLAVRGQKRVSGISPVTRSVDVNTQALGNEPISLAPYGGRKRALHATILAQILINESVTKNRRRPAQSTL